MQIKLAKKLSLYISIRAFHAWIDIKLLFLSYKQRFLTKSLGL